MQTRRCRGDGRPRLHELFNQALASKGLSESAAPPLFLLTLGLPGERGTPGLPGPKGDDGKLGATGPMGLRGFKGNTEAHCSLELPFSKAVCMCVCVYVQVSTQRYKQRRLGRGLSEQN